MSPANQCREDVGDILTEPTVYHPYPKRVEFADVIAKEAHYPQVFQDAECWSGLGLELLMQARFTDIVSSRHHYVN